MERLGFEPFGERHSARDAGAAFARPKCLIWAGALACSWSLVATIVLAAPASSEPGICRWLQQDRAYACCGPQSSRPEQPAVLPDNPLEGGRGISLRPAPSLPRRALDGRLDIGTGDPAEPDLI